MKTVPVAVVCFLLAVTPAVAQRTCVEVEIGGEKASVLSCLNQQLRQQADSLHPRAIPAPTDATSSAVRVGGYNTTAIQQQYGPNFGKSAVPWRPTETYRGALR